MSWSHSREIQQALIAALLLSVLATAGCGDAPHNVVLITVDTLRADHLHHAGYPRPSSPAIDELAESGLVFPQSYSVSGWTLPSIATLLPVVTPRTTPPPTFVIPWNRPFLPCPRS